MTDREASRRDWNTTGAGGGPTVSDIETGALQRIADACELMAQDRQRMERDLNWLRNAYKSECAKTTRLYRQVAGLRGYIKRIKEGSCKSE